MPIQDIGPSPLGVVLTAVVAWFMKRQAQLIDKDFDQLRDSIVRLHERIDRLEERIAEAQVE
jgi:hypothetical protein